MIGEARRRSCSIGLVAGNTPKNSGGPRPALLSRPCRRRATRPPGAPQGAAAASARRRRVVRRVRHSTGGLETGSRRPMAGREVATRQARGGGGFGRRRGRILCQHAFWLCFCPPLYRPAAESCPHCTVCVRMRQSLRTGRSSPEALQHRRSSVLRAIRKVVAVLGRPRRFPYTTHLSPQAAVVR